VFVLPSLELSFQRGCHSGGGGGITCRSPKKSVKKNILRISPEPKKSDRHGSYYSK